MQRTAISNPYFMDSSPKERTPITFAVGSDRAHCYGCGRTALPRIIQSRFIGNKTGSLAVCPYCNTLIQDPPAKPEPKAKKPQTVFLWQCFGCGAQYPEEKKLPVMLGPNNVTGRVCIECGGRVFLVEKKP